MLKPKGQREKAHRHSGASSGIKKKNHVSKQAGIYVLPLCIYFHFQILEFVASKFCVIYIFHCPHFFGNMVIRLCIRLFFSMPTLTEVQSLSNLFLYLANGLGFFLSQTV